MEDGSAKDLPVSTSDSPIPSSPIEARTLLVGENATYSTWPACLTGRLRSRPLDRSQICTAWSPAPPDANLVPSGENASVFTRLSCPDKTQVICPVATSQSEIFLSAVPTARDAVSGEKAEHVM